MSGQIICIIEDNLPIRKLFATLLRKSGFEIFDFGDGKSALSWFSTNKPDIVILDILLPDINGTELLPLIRSIEGLENLTAIAVTGFAGMYDKEKYLEIGFNGYISKPISTATFVDEVKAFLNN